MAFKCITLIYFLHQERDDEFCLTIKWMAVQSTGVGVSKMALCLCHSSSRCHMLVSSMALTSPLFTCSAYSTCKQFAKTLWARWTIPTAWLIFSLRCHLCVIQHLLNWKKKLSKLKSMLENTQRPSTSLCYSLSFMHVYLSFRCSLFLPCCLTDASTESCSTEGMNAAI